MSAINKHANSMKLESSSLYVLGLVLIGISLFMLPCVVAAALTGDPLDPFLWPATLGFAGGLVLSSVFRLADVIRPVNGLFMLGLVWLATILFGATPFLIAGFDSFDAIFESTSGFTTCGGTILADIDSQMTSILLWRSVTQWLGGIAIIFIFLFIMPLIGFGGRVLFGNEMHGSGAQNFTARMKDAGRQFFMIYAGLSVFMALSLLALEVPPLEAICITMSGVSTGGFMPLASSMTNFSLAVKWVVIVFMFLGATNFYLHFRFLFSKEPSVYLKNREFRVMLMWFTAAIMFIIVMLYESGIYGGGVEDFVYNATEVSFNFVSMVTSTGFCSGDFTTWTHGAVVLLFVGVFIGSSAGSTAGGVKVSRTLLVITYLRNGLRKLVYPHAVFDVKSDGQSVDDNTVNATIVVFILFIGTIIVGTLVVMLFGIPINEALTTTISCVTDTGVATGNFGPTGSYASAPGALKLFYSLLMWMGRLEITAALALFMPGFWKELVKSGTSK